MTRYADLLATRGRTPHVRIDRPAPNGLAPGVKGASFDAPGAVEDPLAITCSGPGRPWASEAA